MESLAAPLQVVLILMPCGGSHEVAGLVQGYPNFRHSFVNPFFGGGGIANLNTGIEIEVGYYGNGSLNLTTISCPNWEIRSPDFNGDGVVNNSDFSPFVSLFNQQHPKADLNFDGAWDLSDNILFSQAIGAQCI